VRSLPEIQPGPEDNPGIDLNSAIISLLFAKIGDHDCAEKIWQVAKKAA
jgi:hypothetical protein